MADRSCFTVLCRAADTDHFEPLGLRESADWEGGGVIVVEMIDEEFNPLANQLPRDIAWRGLLGSSAGYSGEEYVCLGNDVLQSWETGQDGGYVFHHADGTPEEIKTEQDRFRDFLEVRDTAKKLLPDEPT